MLYGLPASGKSTWAKEQNIKRVNKDDLRLMIDNSKWSKNKERFILQIRDRIIEEALSIGESIIVDDTNLSPKHETKLREIAKKYNAEFEIKDFTDILVDECIERDKKRINSVGETVIRNMYRQFLSEKITKKKEFDDVYLVDIDGTVALVNDRSPFDWLKVGKDKLNEDVAKVIYHLPNRVIFMSGRDSVCREITEQWLQDNKFDYIDLLMREKGDNRKDSIVKKELFEKNIKDKYNVIGIFDDRKQVVDMWRDMGLTVFQVADGNF
jgi:predicted kinase